MATTIKVTPILKGKESERFNKSITSVKSHKISEAKKSKIFALVGKIMAKKA